MTKRDKVKNITQIAKGRVKEAAGKNMGDEEMQNEGKLDRMEGNLKQAGEKVKDALKE